LGKEDRAAGEERSHVPLLKKLGPGLITGAADDDPSGIATYSQAGAQYGYGLLWSVAFTTPLMIGIQVVSARIGRVTGHGLAANIRDHFPKPLLYFIVFLLLAANTFNLAADLGAMADALVLIAGGNSSIYIVFFALLSLVLQIFIPFPRYAPILKWLTLALFAYVGTVLVVHVPGEGLRQTLLPHLVADRDYVSMLVAVLGTTISPYLFFWQASQEVEDNHRIAFREPLVEAPEQGKRELARIRIDTYIGMAFSNLVALAIMVTTAATLHATGVTNIETSTQAAKALEPVAGHFAFTVFTLGIVGTGLLAVPVLAGSGAYALAEAHGWPEGLARKPRKAVAFYTTIALAILVGALINFSPINPIKALYWSAVINGVVAVPVMAIMMMMTANRKIMGQFVVAGVLRVVGWTATAVMAAAVVGMVVTMFA
jgi:NRAMP (natural resistance-associated macrophage protein)-like metal ion transporter